MSFDIVPIDPADPVQRTRIEEWTEVRARSEVLAMGEYATTNTVEEVVSFAAEPSMDRRYWGAVVDGRVVGSLVVVLPCLDDQPVGFLGVHVHPDHRLLGIGSALLSLGQDRVREGGRTQAATQTHFLPQPGDMAAAFLERAGYSRAITSLQSQLRLDSSPNPARPVADGYQVETAEGVPPEPWLEDLAWLMSRMSTDAPQGDLDWAEETWDAARYAENVRTQLDAGRRMLTSVAREAATGRLVAFTVAVLPAATPELAIQHETLVVHEHRGHGLGVAVKEALIARLRERAASARVLRTWNADSNTHMLAVNRALGFEVVAAETDWQKRL